MKDAGDIDWQKLHRRIEHAMASADRLLSPDEDAARRILAERARLLARPARSTIERADGVSLAYFRVGREEMAIEARFVQHVAEMPPLAPVPWLPPVFLGVVNHRGTVLPVVHLAILLSREGTAEACTSMLVLGEHALDLGVAITDAETVVSVPASDIAEDVVPEHISAGALVRGVIGGRRIVLRAQALLLDPRLTVPRDV